MIEPSERMIDGLKIQLSPLPARQAARVLHRLGKSISPSVARLLGVFRAGEVVDLAKLDIASLGGAFSSFFETCSESDLDYFINQLLVNARVDHKPLLDVVDTVFQAKILTLFKVLIYAVEVNYNDFFGGLRGALAAQQASTQTASTSKAA